MPILLSCQAKRADLIIEILFVFFRDLAIQLSKLVQKCFKLKYFRKYFFKVGNKITEFSLKLYLKLVKRTDFKMARGKLTFSAYSKKSGFQTISSGKMRC
jgi:hypothetical protein